MTEFEEALDKVFNMEFPVTNVKVYSEKYVEKLQAEIEHLRTLTSWHTGVPEEDGEYVVEGSDFVGVATFSDEKWASLAFRPWDRVIRWAYLPTEGE